MKTNTKTAGRYARKPRYTRIPTLTIKRRPFDPVAYAAALEILG